MNLETKELLNITGGGITSAMITSVVRLLTTVIDFGKMVGSSIRRATNKNYC